MSTFRWVRVVLIETEILKLRLTTKILVLKRIILVKHHNNLVFNRRYKVDSMMRINEKKSHTFNFFSVTFLTELTN